MRTPQEDAARITALHEEIARLVRDYKAAGRVVDELLKRRARGEHPELRELTTAARNHDDAWRLLVDARLDYAQACLVGLAAAVDRLEQRERNRTH